MARAPKVRNQLQTFLNTPINTTTRERIFFNKLYFDVKLAAARRGYALTVFEPEVDRDGFDVVFDDADSLRQLQLKSTTRSANANSWTTTPRFLRPTCVNLERMAFEASSQGEGRGGGIVMILIDDATEACDVRYFYTDLFVIAALAFGLIRAAGKGRKPVQQARRRQAESVMKALWQERNPYAELRIPKGVFLETKSPDALLAIAGFHSVEHAIMWSENFLTANHQNFEADDNGVPKPELTKDILAHAHSAAIGLLSLVKEDRLEAFQSGITG